MFHKMVGLFFFLTLFACDNPKSYSLEELEKNEYNSLGIRVEPALKAEGFQKIFDEFKDMNTEQILARLSAKDLELHVASIGMYYLANSYIANGDIEQALKYHTIAAQKYINPQSLLKLAEYYFSKEKDFTKAYEFLHQSLEVTVEITDNNRSHPIARNGKNKAQHLLQEMERAGDKGVFDKAAVRTKLKAELPALLDEYRKMYGLGPREGAQGS